MSDTAIIKGRLVNYDCKPVPNKKVKVVNILREGDLFSDSITRTHIYTTDNKGYFKAKTYLGSTVKILHDKWKSHEWYQLHYAARSFNYNEVKYLQENKATFMLYDTYKSDIYRRGSTNKWLVKPRVVEGPSLFSPKNRKKITPAGNIILSYSHLTGIHDLLALDIYLKPVDILNLHKGWKVVITFGEGGGIKKTDPNNDMPYEYPPIEGYKKEIEISLEHGAFPYEKEKKWEHNIFYIKQGNGDMYGVLSLDMGFTSSFSEKDFIDLLPKIIDYRNKKGWDYRPDLSLIIWSKLDYIISKQGSTPIPAPYIPQKKCGGVFSDSVFGYYGHHPQFNPYIFRGKNKEYWKKQTKS